jgi:hypothetical protein
LGLAVARAQLAGARGFALAREGPLAFDPLPQLVGALPVGRIPGRIPGLKGETMGQGLCLLTKPNIIVREEGDEGEALLFDPETERLKVLNRTGFLLWNWCDGHRTQRDLTQMLSERYPSADRDTVQADVGRFVQQMLDLGMMESVASAS